MRILNFNRSFLPMHIILVPLLCDRFSSQVLRNLKNFVFLYGESSRPNFQLLAFYKCAIFFSLLSAELEKLAEYSSEFSSNKNMALKSEKI